MKNENQSIFSITKSTKKDLFSKIRGTIRPLRSGFYRRRRLQSTSSCENPEPKVSALSLGFFVWFSGLLSPFLFLKFRQNFSKLSWLVSFWIWSDFYPNCRWCSAIVYWPMVFSQFVFWVFGISVWLLGEWQLREVGGELELNFTL